RVEEAVTEPLRTFERARFEIERFRPPVAEEVAVGGFLQRVREAPQVAGLLREPGGLEKLRLHAERIVELSQRGMGVERSRHRAIVAALASKVERGDHALEREL